MATMQDVVDLARIDLNDADKVRWADTDLLRHANAALALARGLRPDLHLGGFATPAADRALGDVFPLPLLYQRAAADYIIGRASAVDNDLGDDARAPAYLAQFEKALTQ